jgi:hypothetical protein
VIGTEWDSVAVGGAYDGIESEGLYHFSGWLPMLGIDKSYCRSCLKLNPADSLEKYIYIRRLIYYDDF